MNEPRHTPGPWEVDDCGNICGGGAALAAVYGAEDFPCLPEEDYDAVNVECAANARLMAAAPDLLAACEKALEFWHSDHPNDTGEAMDAREFIRRAVARAKGEST